jgi:hypothetical protein
VLTVLETIQHATDEHEEENQKNPTTNHAESHDMDMNLTMNKSTNEEDIYYKTNYNFDDADTIEDLSLRQEKETDPICKDPKQEYLHWHHKLGHLSHGRMLQLINNGNLPKYLSMKTPPICVACINGKETKRPWRTKAEINASRQATFPGECVAVDQLESSTAGFIGQMRGAILTNQRYRYATVFVDMFSNYTFIYMHTAISTEETVKAKKAFEKHADSFGVRIRQYHADNDRFQDIKFKEDCAEQSQRITYCGVNAHFQNRRAERKIRDLQDGARTSLLHAMKKWPSAINVHLWPYAMRYINDINNYVPRKGRQESPMELFGSLKQKNKKLYQFHHFGCPVYVLDHHLQSGRKSGMKWKERVSIGVNLGFSPQHAKSVHLVLSLTSGCVSPQFHCTFDTNFELLKEYSVPESLWQEKAHFVVRNNKQKDQEKQGNLLIPNELESTSQDVGTETMDQTQPEPELDPTLQTHEELEPPVREELVQDINPNEENAGLRRSNRIRKIPRRYDDYVMGHQTMINNPDTCATHIEGEVLYQTAQIETLALKSVTDPDTLYLWQARKEPDFPKFMEVMQKEIDDHMQGGHWKIMKRSEVPEHATVLPAVWSMKRKRRISDRQVYKWKARLNIDGSKQVYGMHYQDTYSPVVSWSTTRFFMIHALLRGWYTKQIDYVMAFPQAPVERDLYMEIPKGVCLEGSKNTRDYVLRIIKNLYGQKQAGRVWYQYLTKGLEEMGFVKSKIDECVFYYKSCLILIYVDDSIIMGPVKSQVQDVIKRISEKF